LLSACAFSSAALLSACAFSAAALLSACAFSAAALLSAWRCFNSSAACACDCFKSSAALLLIAGGVIVVFVVVSVEYWGKSYFGNSVGVVVFVVVVSGVYLGKSYGDDFLFSSSFFLSGETNLGTSGVVALILLNVGEFVVVAGLGIVLIIAGGGGGVVTFVPPKGLLNAKAPNKVIPATPLVIVVFPSLIIIGALISLAFCSSFAPRLVNVSSISFGTSIFFVASCSVVPIVPIRLLCAIIRSKSFNICSPSFVYSIVIGDNPGCCCFRISPNWYIWFQPNHAILSNGNTKLGEKNILSLTMALPVRASQRAK